MEGKQEKARKSVNRRTFLNIESPQTTTWTTRFSRPMSVMRR
jgi:hypothetical protein